jgi:predicted metalloprotease
MTFNDNARVGRTTAQRRGAGVAVGAGGVAGLGAIAVLLLNLFTGGDFSGLLGGGAAPQGGSAGGTAITDCQTGADANRDDTCRLVLGAEVVNSYWSETLQGYRPPQLVIVDGSTPSRCGTASNATGPFYCPPEETVYIDPTFFSLLRERFGASGGDLAQLYVLAHEYGHHVQQLIGVFDQHPNNGSGPDSNGVRIELQADCFAGAWVASAASQLDANGVPYLQPPTEAEIADALNAAEVVGDDHIQESTGGFINPESWTHGSSEQRQRWFAIGYQQGAGACDTFSVSGSQL